MWPYLHPSDWEMNLVPSVLISAIIHLILVLILPGFTPSQLVSIKPYIEVSLLPPPQLIKEYTSPAPPKKRRVEAGKWQALAPQLPGRNQYYRAKSYQPLVELPATINKKEVVNLLPEEVFSVDELLRAPLATRPLTQGSPQFTPRVPEGSSQPTSAEISWSGPPRRYLYKPPDPSYSSKIEGEVKLKFWVDPQGNVTNVVILKKLDAQLERLAIDYMKRWRFEPLKEKGQELQWGTINIKFRLE